MVFVHKLIMSCITIMMLVHKIRIVLHKIIMVLFTVE